MNYIRYYRKKAQLSQEALAELVNVSLMTVRRWDTSLREPRASDIKKLCEVLGCSESVLLNGPERKELKINIVWEVEDMDLLKMESNEFNIGLAGDRILIWGAIADDENDEVTARAITKQIKAARAGKAAVKKELSAAEV